MIQLKIRLLGVKQQSTIQRIFYNDDVLKLFEKQQILMLLPLVSPKMRSNQPFSTPEANMLTITRPMLSKLFAIDS
jgi:hypothetical protein